MACFPTNLRRTPAHLCQNRHLPSDEREGHVDAPSVATLAPAGLCPRPEAKPADVLGTQSIPGAGGLTHHRLYISKLRIRLQSRRKPQAVAAATADENASVDNPWCQLRDTVQSTTLAVLGSARRQHRDRFDDNDAAISNLLAEKNRLHKACVNRPTDENKGMERSVKVRVRPCHLPAPSIVSDLLDSVWTLGPVEEERVRKTLRKSPCLLNLAMEHTVDVIGNDGRNIT
nr:unnamed protein product [Spirometra erinaceieuropaei]